MAEGTGLPPETVERIIRAYYKHVQGELSSLQHLAVDLPGLGVFSLKPARSARKVLRITGLLKKIAHQTSLRSYSIRTQQQHELDRLTRLTARQQVEQERRQQIRQDRYEKPTATL